MVSYCRHAGRNRHRWRVCRGGNTPENEPHDRKDRKQAAKPRPSFHASYITSHGLAVTKAGSCLVGPRGPESLSLSFWGFDDVPRSAMPAARLVWRNGKRAPPYACHQEIWPRSRAIPDGQRGDQHDHLVDRVIAGTMPNRSDIGVAVVPIPQKQKHTYCVCGVPAYRSPEEDHRHLLEASSFGFAVKMIQSRLTAFVTRN